MAVLSKKNSSPYRWIVLLFLFAAFTLQFSTYLSWNPFIPMAHDLFGFTASQSAMVVAAVACGRMMFQIPGGIVVDMFSAKRLLAVSMAVLAACTALVGVSGTYAGILAGQFCIGMAGVVVMPLCIKVVIEYFPPKETDIVSGVLNSAASVAVIVTNILVPFAAVNWQWNSAFYIMAAGCAIVGLLICTCLHLPAQQAAAHKKFELRQFTDLLKDKRFRLALAAHAGAIYTTWGINSWLAMYLSKSAGLDTPTVSQMMLVFGLCGCISMASAGLFTRGSFRKRCVFLFGIFITTLIMLLVLPLIKNEAVLWVYTAVLGIAAFAHFGPLNIFVSNLVESRVFATAMAVSIFIWQIASIMQSLLIGRILDFVPGDAAYHLMFAIIGMGSVSSCLAIGRALHQGRKIRHVYYSYVRRAKGQGE